MTSLRRYLILAALLALAVPAIALASHAKQGIYLKQLKSGDSVNVTVAPGRKKVTDVFASCAVKGFTGQGYNISKKLSVNSKGRFYFHGKIKLAAEFPPAPIATLTAHGHFIDGGKYVNLVITGTQRTRGKRYTCQKVNYKLKFFSSRTAG